MEFEPWLWEVLAPGTTRGSTARQNCDPTQLAWQSCTEPSPADKDSFPKGSSFHSKDFKPSYLPSLKNIKIKKSNAQRYGYHLPLAVPGFIVYPFFLSSLAVCDVWKTKRSKLYNNCCLLSIPTAQQKHKKWTSSFLKERELFHLIWRLLRSFHKPSPCTMHKDIIFYLLLFL